MFNVGHVVNLDNLYFSGHISARFCINLGMNIDSEISRRLLEFFIISC